MSELIGTARVELTLDSTQFEANVARSKNAAHGMGAEAEAAFQGLEGRAKRAATSILQYANNLGQSTEQQRLNNAALRGAPIEIIQAVADKINAQHFAQQQAAKSARELAEASKFEELRRAGEHMRRTIEYTQLFGAELDRLEAKERKTAAAEQFIQTLQRQTQAIGKTRSELLALQAAEHGVAAEAAPMIAKLREQERQLHVTGAAFNAYGLSAKQTAAALRQVPAQLTDIFVSLQGGQNPLTVFLQQGGQLRDVFGGAMPALRAMSAQLLSMINVWTVGAAALGTLGVAWYQATEESRKFADALVLTGNRVGMTNDQLADMAERLDDLAGTTRGEAAEAMTAILSTGQFTASQFALVTEAALQMQYATGRAINETTAEFEKLRRDPVQAIIELGNTYGYLDQALLDNIRNLVRNGETQAAAQLAIETHANMIGERTPQIVANMGLIQGALHGMGSAARETWDEATGLFARMDRGLADFASRVKNLRSEIAGWWSAGLRGQLAQQGVNVPMPDERKTPEIVTPERARAQEQLRQIEAQYDEIVRRRLEIERIEATAREAGLSTLATEELIAKARAKHAEEDERRKKKGGRGAQALENAELRAGLQEYRDILAQQQNAIQNDSKMLEAEYAARLIDAETYYDRQRDLITRDMQAQEQALTGQITFLRSRDVAGKEAVDVQRQLGELEAKLAAVRANGATQLAVLGIQETATAKARQQAIDAYADTLERANETLQRQVNAEIASIGLGSRVAEQQRQIAEAYVERDERLRELQDRLERDNDQAAYTSGLAALQIATDERVRIITDGFRRMDAARASWENGMTAGIQNWLDEATDVAGQVQRIWENSLDRTTDALVEFAETGRFEWRSFLADILRMLLDFYAKQAVAKFAQMFVGMFTNGFSGDAGAKDLSGTVDPFKSDVIPLSKSAPAALASTAAMGAGGKSSNVTIHVETNVATDGSASTKTTTSGEDAQMYAEFTERVRLVVLDEFDRQSRQGGMLWRAGVQR
jgi:lambda family phage tail tape measure protein